LQDEQGKRYPPKPEIAKKLLKQKRSVWLMRRSINLYWYEHESIQQHQIEPQEHTASPEQVWLEPDYSMSSHEVVVPTQSMPIQSGTPGINLVPFPKYILKPEPQKELKTHPKRTDRFYKQPLPDDSDEWLAQQIYLATGNLQEVEARQLVDKYGREAVERALGQMEFMRAKGDLQNPAGFIKVVSRVCWLAINGFDAARPEYKSPKKRKPHKTTFNLKQDPIWQSEAYRQWRLSFAETPIDVWEMPYLDSVIEF